MINPQMMGMGQLPNMPTVKELWRDEKSKYRHWMILFAVGVLVVFALLLSSIILSYIDQDSVKYAIQEDAWKSYASASDGSLDDYLSSGNSSNFSESLKAALDAVGSVFKWKFFIIPAVQLSLVGLGLGAFLYTVFQSYQEHSFHKLSTLATGVIAIGAIISIYQLIQLFWNGTAGTFNSRGGLFLFITYFITIAVYFSGSIQVVKIRRMFFQAFRVEQLKNSPEYQAAMQQMQQMQNGQMPNGFANGPFGPSNMGTPHGSPTNMGPRPGQQQTPGQQHNNAQAQGQTQAMPAKSSERIDLESMTVVDLKKVANQLDISGFASMKKPELVEAILRVTENK